MTSDERRESTDDLVRGLRALRDSAGVSYRDLALRIAADRTRAGMSPAEARVAHTTVSDVFRVGRTRINAHLVVEIVRALGEDADAVALWRERATHARATGSAENSAETSGSQLEGVSRIGSPFVLAFLVVVAGVLLNSTGKFVNPLLGNVLFLDMIGTAVVALLLGPWRAALVGVLFAGVELLKGSVHDALFAITMVTAGLIWGYGVQRFGLGRTLPRFLVLSAIVATVTTAIAVPIVVLSFGGYATRGMDPVIAGLTDGGVDVWAAVGTTNLGVSFIDKVLTGAIAFGIAGLVGRAQAARANGSTYRLPKDLVRR